MINYLDTIELKPENELNISFKRSSKINFSKTNDIQVKLALIHHFLYNCKELPEDKIRTIKNNIDELVLDDAVVFDTGCFKCKMYQSDSIIACFFYNDTYKLNKTILTSYINYIYLVLEKIFVRPKLSLIDVKPDPIRYSLGYTIEHGPEISISIQDLLDSYKTIITTELYESRMNILTSKEEPISDEPSLIIDSNTSALFEM
jgi:hypothetical protein